MLRNATRLLAQRCVQQESRRGKAIAGWKRPHMDELLVPTENWAQANAKIQSRNTKVLVAGILMFVSTWAFGYLNGYFFMYRYPADLVKQVEKEIKEEFDRTGNVKLIPE